MYYTREWNYPMNLYKYVLEFVSFYNYCDNVQTVIWTWLIVQIVIWTWLIVNYQHTCITMHVVSRKYFQGFFESVRFRISIQKLRICSVAWVHENKVMITKYVQTCIFVMCDSGWDRQQHHIGLPVVKMFKPRMYILLNIIDLSIKSAAM